MVMIKGRICPPRRPFMMYDLYNVYKLNFIRSSNFTLLSCRDFRVLNLVKPLCELFEQDELRIRSQGLRYLADELRGMMAEKRDSIPFALPDLSSRVL